MSCEGGVLGWHLPSFPLLCFNVGDLLRKHDATSALRGVVVVRRQACGNAATNETAFLPAIASPSCRQQMPPHHFVSWLTTPHNGQHHGACLAHYPPRAFLISPGTSAIFRGRPGVGFSAAFLARGPRMNPLAEASTTTPSSVQARLVRLFTVILFSFFVTPFSLFNITGQSSQKFLDFSAGHGMLARLDGKSNFWEHNFGIWLVWGFLGATGVWTGETKRHNSTCHEQFWHVIPGSREKLMDCLGSIYFWILITIHWDWTWLPKAFLTSL